jgi:succinate dehydrogenase / fumarate reductase flavoprotein subunit
MGGLWVDYTLQTTIPGLFAIGEANFSDHGANRLGASAMMQALADGYFILPHCVTDYLAGVEDSVDAASPEFSEIRELCDSRLEGLLEVGGKTPATVFHRRLGSVMLDRCGITREADGLKGAIGEIREIRDEFWRDLRVDGSAADLNQSLEYAGRVADFLEFAELMCVDAIERDESCGCHLREEHQSEEGEAVRDDSGYAHAQVWEHTGADSAPSLHHERFDFEVVEPTTRSYK